MAHVVRKFKDLLKSLPKDPLGSRSALKIIKLIKQLYDIEDTYSILETAKANNVEPSAYLSHVLEKIPSAETAEDFETLLPQNFTQYQAKLKKR